MKLVLSLEGYLSLWEMLWPLGSHLATFHALVRQVEKGLYTPKRASSLVESFNSKLRTVQYVKKQVSQETCPEPRRIPVVVGAEAQYRTLCTWQTTGPFPL